MWRHFPSAGEAISTHSWRTFPTLSECVADAKLHGYQSDALQQPGAAREHYGIFPRSDVVRAP
jgi:hypothetical protein